MDKQPKITRLEEYVCEHWALSPEHLRNVNICAFNNEYIELPLSKSDLDGKVKTTITGYGTHGYWPEGFIPEKGPIVFFSTLPLWRYLSSITPDFMKRRLEMSPEGKYAINVFTQVEQFEQFCQQLQSRLPSHIKIDKTTRTGNDEKFYGRGGGDGGDFNYRELASPELNLESQPSTGDIRQYTSGFRHRRGFIYANQIQISWKGSPTSTIGLINAVASEVVEHEHEAHFGLAIDRYGLMGRIGITGVFYRP